MIKPLATPLVPIINQKLPKVPEGKKQHHHLKTQWEECCFVRHRLPKAGDLESDVTT